MLINNVNKATTDKNIEPKQKSSPSAQTSRTVDEKEFASIGGSVSPMTQCNEACASTETKSRSPNIRIIRNDLQCRTISD
ncbi:unnamed protein product [Penicillium roqueforti FM164]|uniref:Genomic scaffold, ProqFM164S04 n=1 Tax=Penicillium roqueforti (strain FM164) TaxID=1365484 RepID=W6QPN2_PENRF|nr:unnamed protein product [Penicillium roqueforti FM164]